jgi:hypothetical protein
MVRLHLAGGQILTLSPDHLLPVVAVEAPGALPVLVRADTVRARAHLLLLLPPADGPNQAPDGPEAAAAAAGLVVDVAWTVGAVGLVAPHTASGTLLVDGVQVSCYTARGKPRRNGAVTHDCRGAFDLRALLSIVWILACSHV